MQKPPPSAAMINPRKLAALFVALVAMNGLAHAADAAAPQPKPATSSAAVPADLQKLIEQFKARRDSLLADRQALLNQLKNATEDQRKAILEKLQNQQKDLIDQQRALGKQIRDEMRRMRERVPSGGPGRR
jgi:hypothetical protein